MLLGVLLPALTLSMAPQVPAASGWSEICQEAAQYSLAHRGVAILVLERGDKVCENYKDGPDRAYELWSGTKSFIGLLAAAAVQDRLLTLDELACDTLPEWRRDPVKSRITIRQLLSMSSGQPSIIGKPPGYREALDVPLVAAPGSKFLYGATPLQTFGEIMRRKLIAAGQPAGLDVYLDRRILSPIGMKYAAWRRGPDGNVLTPQGLRLTAGEWSKVGEFVRMGGAVNGKQLVDPEAFRSLFTPSPANPAYGMTWWLPHASAVADPITAETDIGKNSASLPADLVEAAGAGDQRLFVIPSLGLTIVRQADLDVAALAAGRSARTGWSDFAFLRIVLRKR